MIQVNRIYLIFNRLVTKKFLVDTSDFIYLFILSYFKQIGIFLRSPELPRQVNQSLVLLPFQ